MYSPVIKWNCLENILNTDLLTSAGWFSGLVWTAHIILSSWATPEGRGHPTVSCLLPTALTISHSLPLVLIISGSILYYYSLQDDIFPNLLLPQAVRLQHAHLVLDTFMILTHTQSLSSYSSLANFVGKKNELSSVLRAGMWLLARRGKEFALVTSPDLFLYYSISFAEKT
jgi:hypothetical protein